jgi:hypothetical protein
MASKTFETVVRTVFAPRMAEWGFVRKGVRYLRAWPPFGVQAIDIQQNRHNAMGYCRFRINLTRAFMPGFSREKLLARGWARKSIFEGDYSVRMGTVTEVREDYWYDYFPDDAAGIEAALGEALADIERYGLRWLRWGIWPIGRRDPTRAHAASARFDAFLASLSAEEQGREPQQTAP